MHLYKLIQVFHEIITFLKTKPVFLFLLPVFFVLHGLTENYNHVLIKDALMLTLIYISVSILMAVLSWLLYKNFYKANLAAFSVMAFNFFFGSIHDFLKNNFPNSTIIKYSFILPLTPILILALIIYIKKTKRTFVRTSKYLNWVFLLLIVVDVGTLLLKITKNRKSKVVNLSNLFINCDTCSRPDIYLIIADEYPGKTTLKTIFSFDNSSFENELQNRGFHIVNHSASNYNPTFYSIASMLSMDYIRNLESDITNHRDMLTCGSLINNNNVVNFFKKNGYSFFNHSFFEFAGKKNTTNNPFYSDKKSLIASQTFINRFKKTVGFNFVSKEKLNAIIKNSLYNINKIDSLTRKIAYTKSTAPKFVYAHLEMPHHPYYFDRNGKEVPLELLEDNYKLNKTAFLEYLLYANNRLLGLIDYINKVSETPPVIMLMSDHGFRQFTDSAYKKFHFINLNSIYLPGGNYSGFYDGMSNVNQFRVLLNSQFSQKLSLLKDSSSFIWEK